ncbi:conserved hypothetical protein [Gluconacetobacter diazotrophicus PA1 5]|nr:hypothetical protein [Gluconacetobacter diazotrophicus]ACI50321.1 conserved hypothetical protein [Gluconacetobacter diazotrophicus PA1 5]TWB08356.1 hypothetical protein FBZ86_10795 [Gluconacetobacter diazotrophicus]
MQDKVLRGLALSLCLVAMAAPALADDEEEAHKTMSLHQLAKRPPIPTAHKDFSQYRYRPAGDKIVEQSDADRLMFWTQDGTPDGYAERRGNAILYYDRTGKAVRVQEMDPTAD